MPCSFPPSPPTPLHPRRGGKGSSTTISGQHFVWGGVHVQTPTFKLAGNHVSLAHTDAACVRFEGSPDTVNATPKKRGHITLLAHLIRPAGRERGWG